MKNHRTHELESWHHTESELAATIGAAMLNEEARESLLRPALTSLAEVKTVILHNAVNASSPADANRWYEIAEHQLASVKKQLVRAQELIEKYGANIQWIGD